MLKSDEEFFKLSFPYPREVNRDSYRQYTKDMIVNWLFPYPREVIGGSYIIEREVINHDEFVPVPFRGDWGF